MDNEHSQNSKTNRLANRGIRQPAPESRRARRTRGGAACVCNQTAVPKGKLDAALAARGRQYAGVIKGQEDRASLDGKLDTVVLLKVVSGFSRSEVTYAGDAEVHSLRLFAKRSCPARDNEPHSK